ncbi:EGF-like domain-containing protein 2 isoform X2 [Tribolium madens]|uniref:EGF-like domain-containing protein 2 isoform X2 n=1 Tax=Tribolium madens TaxID=41895 RepID=UPI001CF7585D|nr:EGF-like domain-containing protein 2 isoform X2 [Tribolium madens]
MKISILFVALWSAQIKDISGDVAEGGQRVARQTSADQMVQNILQWLQGVYTQNSRKIRQGTLREYLPPSNTQKPRPFEPQGYPPSGITPQPPFPIYTNPTTGYPSPTNEITPPHTGPPQPPFTGYPTTGFPSQRPTFPTGYPTQRPQPPTGYPTQRPGFPTQPPTGYPSQRPAFPTQRPTFPTTQPPTPAPTYGPPVTTPQTPAPSTATPITSAPSTHFTSPAITTEATPSPDENNIVPTTRPGPTEIPQTPQPGVPTDEDLKHPPHIHAIDVECAKDMMTITIEFNREFNGVIYSKGYYNTPECRYVNENSEMSKYRFTVSLNSCGTEFINAFDTQGQSYLENVLVIQNEQGIQEVWDTIRAVRCLWEGNLKDSLSVALSVGMLSQEIVTFSGDTAMAKLDIQLGKGPFAPPANGLVKIGEQMTLVISVSGDPGFDIQVKDCRATDSTGERVYPLTDENGCILKPKLFGAFQKTRNTGNTGASIIAYAFFNAFKFPDVMDLMIQCNIELCKTDCQMCPEPNQQIEPGRRRRRRDLSYYNSTDGVTMGKHLRVVLAEDLNDVGNTASFEGEVCMTTQNFLLVSAILISLLTASSVLSACLWLKNQRGAHKG